MLRKQREVFLYAKRNMVFINLLIIAGYGLTACRSRMFGNSQVHEALQASDDLAGFGLPTNVTSADVLALRAGGTLRPPWSDTYWPLSLVGLANRYQLQESEGEEELPTPVLSKQLTRFFKATNPLDPLALSVLSPAEKYDFLKGAQPPEALLKTIAAVDQSAGNVDALTKKKAALFIAIQKIYEKEDALHQETNRLVAEIAKKASTGAPPAESAVLQRRLDGLNRAIDQLSKAAGRQEELVANLDLQLEKGNKERSRALLPSISQLLRYMPMTAAAWQEFATYTATYKDDWGWMGHCHGWSAASLLEAAPQVSVLAQRGQQQVFFTEGDLRGLLTKTWAEDAPPRNERFGGQRCELKELARDARNRILDGQICMGNTASCDLKLGKPIYIKRNFLPHHPLIEFASTIRGFTTKMAVLGAKRGEDLYDARIYSRKQFDDAGGNPQGLPFESATIRLQLACRDLNPAFFHVALMQYLGREKRGFIMDRDRIAEVWNQPVFRYESAIVPVQKKSGVLSGPAELVDINDVRDVFRPYRSPGTRYMLQVQSKVWYGVENGPLVVYKPDDEGSMESTYSYTLEFDAQQKLIGGEWGLIPNGTKKQFEEDYTLADGIGGSDTPDFIWAYTPGARPTGRHFDYSLIDRLHQCSLNKASAKLGIFKDSLGTPIPYVDCPL